MSFYYSAVNQPGSISIYDDRFDNITLGTDIPWKAPEGDASLILFGIGLAGLAGLAGLGGLGGASRRR